MVSKSFKTRYSKRHTHPNSLTAMLKMPSDGVKIRLTSESSPQEHRLLPPDLVRQHQVKGGSRSVMHNGMSLQSCFHCNIMIFSLPFARIALAQHHTTHDYLHITQHPSSTDAELYQDSGVRSRASPGIRNKVDARTGQTPKPSR